MAWLSYIGTGAPGQSNSHWTAGLGDMSWDGAAWQNDGFPELSVHPSATWEEGFRPPEVRVTYTATGNFTLKVYDKTGSGTPIAQQAAYASLQEVVITFVGGASSEDIGAIAFEGANIDLQVTDIEFGSDEYGVAVYQLNGTPSDAAAEAETYIETLDDTTQTILDISTVGNNQFVTITITHLNP